jgi:hypothetical protein
MKVAIGPDQVNYFVLMTFSCLNLTKKHLLRQLRSFRVRNPGIVTVQRTFGMQCVDTRPTQEKGILESLQPEDVWNAMCQHLHYTGVRNPGIITIRRTFRTRCANIPHYMG